MCFWVIRDPERDRNEDSPVLFGLGSGKRGA